MVGDCCACREEHVSRQLPLHREVVHDFEEALEVLERALPLRRHDVLPVALARATPPPGHLHDRGSARAAASPKTAAKR
jgi:hypothetical protein